MSAHPIVVIDDELLRKLPERFQSDPRYRKGASLELVPIAEKQDWKTVGGLGGDAPGDPNASLERERLRELEDQAHWRHG